MGVARDHDFDVLDFETELLHVRNDHIVHFGRARIEQNVALWRGDQIGAILAAHSINVADDSERFWKGLLPSRGRGLRRDERPQEQNCRTQQHPHIDPAHNCLLNPTEAAYSSLSGESSDIAPPAGLAASGAITTDSNPPSVSIAREPLFQTI